MVVAELALVAEIHHFLHVGGGKLLHVPIHRVDVQAVEHHLERRAEQHAAPAAGTDVVDAAELPVHRILLPEIRLPDVERHPFGSEVRGRGGGAGRPGSRRPTRND
jgi:hypothetical protein